MIEFIFKLTPSDASAPRDIMVRIHDPISSRPGRDPWTATVDVDGRSYATTGLDPLDAIENACRHAAITLRMVYEDDVIDPPIEPRTSASPAATPP